jgi:hypothetical protein
MKGVYSVYGHKNIRAILAFSFLTLLLAAPVTEAQQSETSSPNATRLIKFSGTLRDRVGRPLSGVMGLTFAVYSAQQGGTPLWMETQNANVDSQGNYTVLLGASASTGLPLELFTLDESRWLGVQSNLPGEEEQPRIMLVSVPYALKAADADTLGGKPLSAFVLASDLTADRTVSAETNDGTRATATLTGGTPDRIAKFDSDGTSLIDSAITESGGLIGVGTTTPGALLDVNGGIRMVSAAGRFDIMKNLTDSSGRRNWGLNTEFSNVGDFVVLQSPTNTTFPSVPRLTINSAGMVGIGTTNPAAALDVNGGIRMISPAGRFDIMKNLTDSSARRNWGFTTEFSSLGDFAVLSSTDNTSFPSVPRLTITNAGMVGIGTTAPSQPLEVAGSLKASGIVFSDNSSLTSASPVQAARIRGINYLGGCETCGALTDSDDQPAIYMNLVGAMTINSVTCLSDTNTAAPIINLKRSGSVSNIITGSGLTCSTAGTTTTSITASEQTLNLNEVLDFLMVTAGGSAKRVTVIVKATVN